MIEIEVPGWRTLQLEHLVLDINGTLAVDGVLLSGVAARLERLKQQLAVLLITADTHGRAESVAAELQVPWHRLTSGDVHEGWEKRAIVEGLGADQVVAVGNGRNDVAMLEVAALSIAVIGGEGAAMEALGAAHLAVTSPNDALELLLHPKRLVATLRG